MDKSDIQQNGNADKTKAVLTTGQVAKICSVAPRTVSKWFDSGQLRGYRIPGSRDRHVPVYELIRFMRAHGMPLDAIDTGHMRVLLIDEDQQFADTLKDTLTREDYEVRVANGCFEAGMVAASFGPHVLIVDVKHTDLSADGVAHQIRSTAELKDTHLVAIGADLGVGQHHVLRQAGYDACLDKPFDAEQLIRILQKSGMK